MSNGIIKVNGDNYKMPRGDTIKNIIDNLPLTGNKVIVAGLFNTRCGLQRGAKLMLADLKSRGIEAYGLDISMPLGHSIDEHNVSLLDPNEIGITNITEVILHINPPEFLSAVEYIRRIGIKARIIGYWAWELQVVSDVWRNCAQYCSDIWVPSPFVGMTILSEIPEFKGGIYVVPHQVDLDPMPRFDREQKRLIRESYGIAPSEFVCGFSFALGSNYTRKNPTAVIDSFMRCFPIHDRKARLFIRCHDSQNHKLLYDHLISYASKDRRIDVFDPSIRRWPVTEFFASINVFVSLHRSEGYGLQIAEAAQAGVAVLATSWGLAPDIKIRPEVIQIGYRMVTALDLQGFYSQFSGARWAEPDTDEAVSWLRVLRDQHVSWC